jgi:hypothetical protein
MNKIACALMALALTATNAQAHGFECNPYGDRRGNAAPIILGILGGVLIGTVIADERRQSPPQAEPQYVPPQAQQRPTAQCADGFFYYGYPDRYTCYNHGGVRVWY